MSKVINSLNEIEKLLRDRGRAHICATLTQEKLIELRNDVESMIDSEEKLLLKRRLKKIDDELNKNSDWVRCLKYRRNMEERSLNR